MTGTPMTGTPMTGTPMTGTPMTGTPMTGTPMTPRRRLTSWLLAALTALTALVGVTGCSVNDSAGQAGDGPTGGPIAAFYGDSYTVGTGASSPARRWSTIVSAQRGWREVNLSVNGLGFVTNRESLPGPDPVDQVISAGPDIVMVTMGLNDNFSMPDRAGDIRAAITDDLTKLASSLPDARLIVVEPFWYTDERPASVDRIIGWARDAAAKVGADYIPGASHWIEGHPEWMADDGVHPNDDGYAAMAERMDAELAKLGL